MSRASRHPLSHLSRREQEIMSILLRRGEATASQVKNDMSDAPSYSAVRTMLRRLEEKGSVKHHRSGAAYVYRPAVSRAQVRQSAVRWLLRTLFDDSPVQVTAAVLGQTADDLTDSELEALSRLVEEARANR